MHVKDIVKAYTSRVYLNKLSSLLSNGMLQSPLVTKSAIKYLLHILIIQERVVVIILPENLMSMTNT